MSTPQSEEQAVQQIYKHAATLVRAGKSRVQVHSDLMSIGLDDASATVVTDNLFAMRAKALREAGQKNMLYGALWFIGGTAVTIITLAAASEGGTYVVAWGAIVFGGIQFFRGLYQYQANH